MKNQLTSFIATYGVAAFPSMARLQIAAENLLDFKKCVKALWGRMDRKTKQLANREVPRAERRESITIVYQFLVSHTDVATLEVKRFKGGGISVKSIARETGLTVSRVEEAIRDLRDSKLIASKQQRERQPDGTWKSVPCARWLLESGIKRLCALYDKTLAVTFQRIRGKLIERGPKKPPRKPYRRPWDRPAPSNVVDFPSMDFLGLANRTR